MKALVAEQGLAHAFDIDSAGTSAHHIGESPDARSAKAARRQGVQLTGSARQFVASDLTTFDYVVALDRKNLAHLTRLALTDGERQKLSLLRAHDDDADSEDVPDPYYEDNFDEVFEICRAACRGLLSRIQREREL